MTTNLQWRAADQFWSDILPGLFVAAGNEEFYLRR